MTSRQKRDLLDLVIGQTMLTAEDLDFCGLSGVPLSEANECISDWLDELVNGSGDDNTVCLTVDDDYSNQTEAQEAVR